MKFTLTGKSPEGLLTIAFILGITIGSLTVLLGLSSNKYWKGLQESIIYSQVSSYVRGCVEISNFIDPKANHYQQCLAGAKNHEKDVREIQEKEPVQIKKKEGQETIIVPMPPIEESFSPKSQEGQFI